MNHLGNFEETRLPLSRLSTIDVTDLGMKKHSVAALIELDVTSARELIKEFRRRTGQDLSFTAWVVKCISEAMKAHRVTNSYLDLRRRKLVTFEDIDITVVIEKDIAGQKAPIPYVVRRTNEKDMAGISREIGEAKTRGLTADDFVFDQDFPRLTRVLLLMPQFIRKLIWRKIMSSPRRVKRTMGTAVVTALGMFGRINGWAIPATIYTLCFALGSITKKPGVVDGRIEVRDYLHLTILLDHDVIDGAPAARFVNHLARLIEGAHGLR